jgi:dimethylglycine dehydrogenase
MVKPEFALAGAEVEIKILDKIYVANVISESPYDPDNAKLRA